MFAAMRSFVAHGEKCVVWHQVGVGKDFFIAMRNAHSASLIVDGVYGSCPSSTRGKTDAEKNQALLLIGPMGHLRRP